MTFKFRKFQEGGTMPEGAPMEEQGVPVEGPAPEEAAGAQDPVMQLAQMAAQALQTQNCELAMQVCEVFVQMIQQAPAGGEEPMPEEQGQPVYARGGKLVGRIRK